MATQSPFSLVGEALEKFATNTQAPAWVVDESLNRVVLFLNHVISREPEAQARLARQKGRCIQLQWQDKHVQFAPSAAG
jgi:ubiquinone biosynthesis protein UbiJ